MIVLPSVSPVLVHPTLPYDTKVSDRVGPGGRVGEKPVGSLLPSTIESFFFTCHLLRFPNKNSFSC